MGKYVVAALGLLILLLGFGVAIYGWIWKEAADVERAKQEKENAEFIIRANKGRVDYSVCDDADGLYDFKSGTCELPAARPSG